MQRILQPRSVLTGDVTHPDKTLRLIKRNKVSYPVRKALRHKARILRKPVHGVRIHPAAPLIQRIGIIPVEQRNVRLNAIRYQFVDQTIVKCNPFLIDGPLALRQNSGPADGEPVRRNTDLFHNTDIFPVAMVVITGHISSMASEYLSGLSAIDIPDIQALSVFLRSAFNLIRRRSRSPYHLFLHRLTLLSGIPRQPAPVLPAACSAYPAGSFQC
mgnify:CR=1 FL=1